MVFNQSKEDIKVKMNNTKAKSDIRISCLYACVLYTHLSISVKTKVYYLLGLKKFKKHSIAFYFFATVNVPINLKFCLRGTAKR